MQRTAGGRRIALVAAAALVVGAALVGPSPVAARGERARPVHLLDAALTGAAEVPGPGDPDGAGVARVFLHQRAGRVCVDLAHTDIATPTAAHIHEGGAGVAGPVVVDLTSTLTGHECVRGVDRHLLHRIVDDPAAFYVNVHNARFPAGAIRGQLFSDHALADEVVLPAGFQPEGIAVAADGTFYVGSLDGGAIYRGDLRTGLGEVLVAPVEGMVAVGIELDGDRLWVAGGPTGVARAYDARTGEELGVWQLASGTTFVNDVVVAGGTAWFTDSFNPALYGVRLGEEAVASLPLSGDLTFTEGFNANGIEATEDGSALIVVQSNTGSLFRVDPGTGETVLIDLGGEDVANGDGLLLHDGALFVVQNFSNQIARIHLADDLASGTVVARLTDPDLDVPTTVGAFADRLWAVNARFTTTPAPDTYYSVVAVRNVVPAAPDGGT